MYTHTHVFNSCFFCFSKERTSLYVQCALHSYFGISCTLFGIDYTKYLLFFNTTQSAIHTDTLGFNENEYGKRLNESFFYFISVLSQNIVYRIIIFMQAIRWREYNHSLFSFNSYFPKKKIKEKQLNKKKRKSRCKGIE